MAFRFIFLLVLSTKNVWKIKTMVVFSLTFRRHVVLGRFDLESKRASDRASRELGQTENHGVFHRFWFIFPFTPTSRVKKAPTSWVKTDQRRFGDGFHA